MIARLALLLALLWTPAAAQRLPPRILLIFDTSGSMGVDVATGEPTGGDNSAEYPGDGNTSRLFVAKNAIASLVETTSEVSFALMRYPQVEGPGINRGILDGHQQNTYAGLDQRPLNYVGECEGVLRAARPADAFSLLVPFGEDNEPDLVRWLDHREVFPADKELRADGPTPIVETLRHAAEYFREVLPGDARELCRPNFVVLLTDGSESCVPEGAREAALADAAAALRAIPAVQGGRAVEVDVKLYVVAFALNQRAIELLSVASRAGGTAIDRNGNVDLVGGRPYEAEDLAGLRAAFGQILRDAIPVEICNGRDDDCDGAIDEGVLNACGGCGPAPAEVCDGVDQDCDGRIDEGVLNPCGRCGDAPPEVCNGIDDDCDGRVDENVANACGGCAGVAEEVCNNLDDDCDGRVDNAPGSADPLSRPCGRDLGACTMGRERCEAGVWRGCDGVAPVDEVCNGVDDDCDGAVDEATVPCGPALDIGDVGECRIGARRCDVDACAADPAACGDDGWQLACEDARGPTDEICDGRDNDCDGMADEGLFNACGRCGETPPEACNGVDDNCDGRIDEDAVCPAEHVCFAGECVRACDPTGECRGEMACLALWPGGRFCHPDPCAGATCPAGTLCDAAARTCTDPCAGAGCQPGEGCDLGECVPATCRHTGCPEGQICRADACVDDPCAGVSCLDDAFCRAGECVLACRGVECGEGRRCHDGECVDDPCGGRCLRTQRCDETDGRCVADPCAGVACPRGMFCADGECTADHPCVGIRCPAGTACHLGSCTDFTPGVPPVSSPARPDAGPDAGTPPGDAATPFDAGADATPDAVPTTPDDDADEGCACGAAGGGSPGAGLPLLLALGWRARRRRQARR